MTTVEHPRPPRAEWNAKSALESFDTSASMSEANQCKNSEVPSSV